MSDYPKKIHECIKRTLLFESGKEVRPVSLCFIQEYLLESMCTGTSEALAEEQRENSELFSYYPNGSRCSTCPFLKSGMYVSDILRVLKTFGTLSLQDTGNTAERRKNYFMSKCVEGFLVPLLNRTRARCYLTFSDSDKRAARQEISDMNFNDMLKLIIEIYDFCKENNIK